MSNNPLKQYFRQPAIYMRLPSLGKFYPPGGINLPPTGELPIYPMTAMDEITYRTPDALFNGQATVNVLSSCVPDVLDHWSTPSLDLDALLIAIRIASFGHDMEFGTKCPKCSHECEHTVDLRSVLDRMRTPDYTKSLKISDMEIFFKPMTYRHMNENNAIQYENQKLLQVLPDGEIPDSAKMEALSHALQRITEVTVRALAQSIAVIKTPQAMVSEQEYVEELLKNCDRDMFGRVRDHIVDLKAQSEMPPMTMVCPECQHQYEQAVTLDMSSFFGVRLLTSSSEQISKLIDSMDKEVNAIRQEALQMAWFMRGGLPYEQALLLGVAERKLINDLIKGNLETTKKSGLPFF